MLPRVIILAAVTILLLIGGGLWSRQHRAKVTTQTVTQQSRSELPFDVPIETTTLSSTTDEAAQGAATRQYIDQLFVHGVTALLPDAPPGQVYAGWLLKNGNRHDSVATGTFRKDGDSYTLDFSSPVDYSDYTDVLVTLQHAGSTQPETDVITGSFVGE